MPKISIILPTYNGQLYIREAIESVIKQIFKDWELIIVDDCSSDNTLDIIKEYEKLDSRIRVIHNEVNKKLPASLNIGFSYAKGEYFTWTSDDNLYLPSALYRMNLYLDENPDEIMVCTGYSIIDENKKVLYNAERYDSDNMFINNYVGACFLYRNCVLEDVGVYNTSKFLVEDYEYWLRILFEYGNIGYIDDVLYYYRTHKGSLTTQKKKEIHNKLLELRKEYLLQIVYNLRKRKDLLCQVFYEFKVANMLNKEIRDLFYEIVPELKIDCGIIKNEKTVEKLSINAPEKTVRITNDIVNNYDNSLGELKILGTLPVNGNTITDGQEQLQNNIDIRLASGIEISDYDTAAIKIYYTENANPSNDLNNAANGWTEVPNNMNAVKSYMIVVNGEFKPSTHLNFGYDITVPANLEFSQSAYTRYTAYYNNLSKLGVVPETKEAAIVGATTGAGPSLSVKLEANREANSDLQAGGIAKFTALVTNNGEADATNVRLTVPTPDGTKAIQYNDAYDTYDTLQGDEQVYTLGTIKPGETVTKVYEIQMMGDIEMFEEGYRKEITYQVSAVSDEDNNPATSNTYTLYKVRGDLEMEMVATTTEEIGIQRGAQIRFRISIENISNIDISNLTVSSTMPDGVKILEGRFEEDRHITDDEVNINGNTVEGIYPNLVQGDNVIFEFIIEIEDYEGQLDVTLAGDGDSINTNYSNTMTYNVNAIDLSFEQTSSSPDYVQEGDELKFSYSIKNNGNSTIPSLYFTNEVPEGLKFKEMTEGVKGEESSTTSNGGAKIIKTTTADIYFSPPSSFSNSASSFSRNVSSTTASSITDAISPSSKGFFSRFNTILHSPNQRWAIRNAVMIKQTNGADCT